MGNKIDLIKFYQDLDALFQKKDINKTINFLEEQQKTAEENDDMAAIVTICNEFGGVCRVTGQTDRAKDLYKKVLKTLEQMDLLGTEQHATTLLNTGDVYISSQEWEQAIDYLSQAREMLIALGLDNDYRMAALCNNISSVYRAIERPEDAEQALKIAFDIIKQIPEGRGELATTYVNLGQLQIKQGKLDEAKNSFTEAVKIFEEATGDKDVHYSAALAGLGEVCFLEKDYENAEMYLIKTLELIDRDFGKTASYETVSKNLEAVRKERAKNG